MNKHHIHQTPAERLAANSDKTLLVTVENSRSIATLSKSIDKLAKKETDRSVEVAGFLGVIRESKNATKKLEEVKSAVLANTIAVKKIPTADLSETNRLLASLIEESCKPTKVTIRIV